MVDGLRQLEMVTNIIVSHILIMAKPAGFIGSIMTKQGKKKMVAISAVQVIVWTTIGVQGLVKELVNIINLMKIIFWNVRGIWRQFAKDKMKELVQKWRIHVLILAEPKVAIRSNSVMKLDFSDYEDDIVHNGGKEFIVNI